ncbi:MAG: tetratricopeptide repeat protein [Verrucomicrobiales bacterium]
MKTSQASRFSRVTALHLAIGLSTGLFCGTLRSQDAASSEEIAPSVWTESDTRLANHYIRLLQKDPAYGNVLDLLWDLYANKDQTPLLLDYFGRASEGGSAVAKLIHAHLLRKNEQFDEARTAYGEVLDAEPENLPALIALAEIADRQNQSSKALSLYTRLVELIPAEEEEGVPFRLRKADLHRLRGQTAEAVEIWNRLLKAFPHKDALRTEIVSLLLETGETGTAEEILEEFAGSGDARRRLDALVELTRLHEFLGDFEEAVDAARRGLALLHFKNHEYADLFARLVRIHERFERLAELEEKLRAGVDESNPTERSLFDLAEFHRLTADPDAEEEAMERLVEILPDHFDYRIRLTDIRMRNDHYDEAAATLDEMLETRGKPPLHLVLLRAKVALRLQNRAEAEALLDEHLERRGANEDEIRQIIEFARNHYMDELVERLLRRRSEETDDESEDGSAPIELARFLHERGREAQAVETLRSYVDAATGGTSQRASRLHRAAEALRELDQPERAIEFMDEALEISPEDPEFLTARANLYVEAGRIEEAIGEFEVLWKEEETLEEKAEIDQRLFSLLRGHYSNEPEPDEDADLLNSGTIQSLAQYRRMAAAASRVGRSGDEPPPEEVLEYFGDILEVADERPTTETRYRAAWWAFKLQDYQECYRQLTQANAEAGTPVLEVETMLFDLAELNERPTLMVRHLTTLAEIDPDHAEDYLRRRAEMRFELGFEDEAVRELERLAEMPDASLSTLGTLAKVYRRQGRTMRQVEVWQKAYRRANVFEKRRIVKQLSTALVENGKPEDALNAQLELLESETDIVQRRKQLDSQITIARSHSLLDWLVDRYGELGRQHAFDRFYPEALAKVHRAAGNTEEAFEAMKRAYYMSGRNENLLGALGKLAEKLGDLKSAIYYRRQLLAGEEGDDVDNWRTLVEMLDKDLRVGEAERLRMRLETKFGSDPDFLRELVDHYLANGQGAAAERTLEKLVALRAWDLQARFQLGLVQSERGKNEAALATFEDILTRTEETEYPARVGKDLLPLIRVSLLPPDQRTSPGGELDDFVFTVEGYPYQGGNMQDEIAETLQDKRPEFHHLPKEPHFIRLRSLEEAAALAARTGRAGDFLEKWRSDERPLFERVWAVRHGEDLAGLGRLVKELPEPGTHADRLFAAYMRLLAGDPEAALGWAAAESNSSGTPHPRSLHLTMASFLLLKDNEEDPLFDPSTAYRVLSRLEIGRNVGTHMFAELRRGRKFETAFRVGEIFTDETDLGEDGNFLFALSQVAGWAGRPERRVRLLDRSLGLMEADSEARASNYFFTALTERLSLMESDEERHRLLDEMRDRLALAGGVPESTRLERSILIALAGNRRHEAIRLLAELSERHVSTIRPRTADLDKRRYDQSQRWKRMSQLLRFYGDRLSLDAETGPAFVAAVGGDPVALPAEASGVAEYEQFEVDRVCHLLEWKNAPERRQIVDRLARRLIEPESRLNLGKTLESRGFHREAIPVYEAEALQKDRDYAPLQGLFDACAEALEPGPALAVIDRVNTREFSAPPGLTVDYLNEQHARFLLIDRDVERLIQLSRAPSSGDASAPVTRHAHLPYQDALVEAYRQSGRRDSLLRLLSDLRRRDEASDEQLLLGGEVLASSDRLEEALEWFEAASTDRAEPHLARQAMSKAAEVHERLGFPDKDRIVALARDSLRQQPSSVTRSLAATLHRAGAAEAGAAEAGATEEAVGILKLLRRGTSDRRSRTSTSLLLLKLRAESGASWSALGEDLETFFQEFVHEPEPNSIEADAETPSPSSNAFRFAEWLSTRDTTGLPDVLKSTAADPGSKWLADLAAGFAEGRLEAVAASTYADGDREQRENLLETLCAFGEEGERIAAEIVDDSRLPGVSFFPHDPRRQLMFFHRIGDRPRLIEVHTSLLREADSDLFHQHGLEDWFPTLSTRRTIPRLLASLGETDLAGRLFRRYHETLSDYQWNDQRFLDDFAEFLIETEAFREAESLLAKVFQKSIRVDLRLLMRLYAAWGKLDEWEERVDALFLSSGRLALLEEWRTALAEGREMVDYTAE